jgi:putative addiction module killer protein
MNTIQIVFYTTKTGKEPFTQWESKLDKMARAVIIRRFDSVKLGNFGDIKRIQGAGIWELRINYGPGYRIYFGKDGGRVIVLLIGGDKSSQIRDIAKAKQYWCEYKESS